LLNLKEDPTVNALEERIANMTGMESALFCSSVTLSNQVFLCCAYINHIQLAIRCHLKQPPFSVVCDAAIEA
jgi:threonine aldolase